MPAGKHDKRISIETNTPSTNAGGNEVPSWSEAAQRWASLEETGGKEVVRAQRVDPTIDAVFVLRDAYASLSVEDRIVLGSRTFNIKAILGADDRTAKRAQIVHVKEAV